jgi:preprotein translocase subunit SecE
MSEFIEEYGSVIIFVIFGGVMIWIFAELLKYIIG